MIAKQRCGNTNLIYYENNMLQSSFVYLCNFIERGIVSIVIKLTQGYTPSTNYETTEYYVECLFE